MRCFFFSKFATETNTFSNIPTTLASFEQREGEDIFNEESSQRLRQDLVDMGIDLLGGMSAYAEPGAPVQQSAYEFLRARLLQKLAGALPVDAILLHLHGAMVSQYIDDCEGNLLSVIRDLVGPTIPIGAMLDPHAHLTPMMLENSTVLAFMKEYPHTDGAERTRDVVRILSSVLDGKPAPVPVVKDCGLLGFFPTQLEPMRGFVNQMRAYERRTGISDISFVHGFPFGDTAHTGAKLLVYGDGRSDDALVVAETLHAEIWHIKDEAMLSLETMDEALRIMCTSEKRPVVVADFADNPGGGAPSDNVGILRSVLEAGLSNVIFGLINDPMAVRLCHEVGQGAKLDLRIGGKTGRASGQPIDLVVEVMAVAEAAHMITDAGTSYPLGDTAWVRHEGVDIVLSSRRMQLLHPSGLTHLGIVPSRYSAIVVKSSNHFSAGFGQLAGQIVYVSAGGALNTHLEEIPYRKLTSYWYPKNKRCRNGKAV